MITKNESLDGLIKVLILSAWIAFVGYFGFGLVSHFFNLIFEALSPWVSGPLPNLYMWIFARMVSYALIAVPVFVFYMLDKTPPSEVGFEASGLKKQILLGLGMGFVLFIVQILIVLPQIDFSAIRESSGTVTLSGWAYAELIINMLSKIWIVALCEEFVFRGYFQAKLRQAFLKKLRWLAPLIQSVLSVLLFYGWLFSFFDIFWQLVVFNFVLSASLGFLTEYFKTLKLPFLLSSRAFFYILILLLQITFSIYLYL